MSTLNATRLISNCFLALSVFLFCSTIANNSYLHATLENDSDTIHHYVQPITSLSNMLGTTFEEARFRQLDKNSWNTQVIQFCALSLSNGLSVNHADIGFDIQTSYKKAGKRKAGKRSDGLYMSINAPIVLSREKPYIHLEKAALRLGKPVFRKPKLTVDLFGQVYWAKNNPIVRHGLVGNIGVGTQYKAYEKGNFNVKFNAETSLNMLTVYSINKSEKELDVFDTEAKATGRMMPGCSADLEASSVLSWKFIECQLGGSYHLNKDYYFHGDQESEFYTTHSIHAMLRINGQDAATSWMKPWSCGIGAQLQNGKYASLVSSIAVTF